MTIEETVDLMMKSSDYNPYTGPLNYRENLIAAINLADLVRDFSLKGMSNEAMGLSVDHMNDVISVLQEKLKNITDESKN